MDQARQLTADTFEAIYDSIDMCKPFFVPADNLPHPAGFRPLQGLRVDGIRILQHEHTAVARFGQWIARNADDRYVVLDAVTICSVCDGAASWIECPTGGWWAHAAHPADGHDAVAQPDACPAGLMEMDSSPVERCVLRGTHGQHLTALGESWTDRQDTAVTAAAQR